MAVVIPIILILVVAAISVVVIAGRVRGSSTGALSRETRRRDEDATPAAPDGTVTESTSTELEAAGRERADETRSSLGGVPARRRGGEVVEYEPVDEEVIGVTRRQFLNRGVLGAVGLGIAGFAPAMLAFLWPLQGQGGFGEPVNIGNLDDIFKQIDANRKPFYAPNARVYIVRFPNENKAALDAAKKIYKPGVIKSMEQGFVPLYQRCPHLGCRVPFCDSSQWFECPCHGSKYNRVGEKTAGPAPRGMDRFLADVSGSGSVTINTGTIFNGPPIGTDTTKQQPEGPLCV